MIPLSYQGETSSNVMKIITAHSKPPGTGNRCAIDFFKRLNTALKNNPVFESSTIQKISDIEHRLKKHMLYTLLAWIPMAEAYELSKLIAQVLSKLIAQVKEQVPAIHKFVPASDKLMNRIDEACAHPHNKNYTSETCTVLYYPLHSDEKGRIGTCYISFLESRGSLLVPFMVEFDKAEKKVRIMEKEMPEFQKHLENQKRYSGKTYEENFYKNRDAIFELIKVY